MHRGVAAILLALAAAAVAGESPALPSSVEPLPFYYDLYTFRGDRAGGTAVVATFAVRSAELKRRRRDRAVRYHFSVSLVLADTVLQEVSRSHDSVSVMLPRALGREHLLSTHIEVEAPPSTNTLQRVIMMDGTTPGIGQLYTTPFPIPDYSGSHLMLSDVALGLPEATTGWTRGENRLALLPTDQIPGRSFDVYYEVYNLPAGTPYVTEITIEPLGRAVDPVRLRLEGDSPANEDGTVRELKRIDTSLAEGQYELNVTVTDQATGEVASRARSFLVQDWGPGVTLVRATPVSSQSAVARGRVR